MREEIKYNISVIVSLIIVAIVGFWIGRLTVKPIIKTVTKEVKVYDFTQAPHIMEIYANTIGKTLVDKNEIDEKILQAKAEIDNDKREIEFMRHKIWQKGYFEGFRARRQ